MKFPPSDFLRATVLALFAATALHGQTQYATPYVFTTLAGVSSVGFRDGAGSNAQFFGPGSLAIDATGNVYVADEGNHLIRKITPAGEVSTLAGLAGVAGTVDGTGSAARFDGPHGLTIDAAGNLYVADTGNHTIRKVTAAGVVTTVAGLAGTAGSTDGTGSAARFNQPFGIAVDPSGNLFVTDTGNAAVRKITPAGAVTNFAAARFIPTVGGAPTRDYGAIAADAAGNVVVSRFESVQFTNQPTTTYNGQVTRYTPAGVATDLFATTVTYGAFNSQTGSFVAGIAFNAAGELVSKDREFAIDRTGNYYFSDFANNTVLRSTATGGTTVVAGIPESSTRLTTDGSASTARFTRPTGVAVDASGNTYVADRESHCIRKIAPDGTVTTLAGVAGQAGSADGTGTAARFNTPTGLALGLNGMLYVADFGNDTIRRVSPSGETHTIAGLAGFSGHEDGIGSSARFFLPRGIAADGTGNVYVLTSGSDSYLRRITLPDGIVTTLQLGGGWYSRPAGPSATSHEFDFAGSVATDAAGNVYVADIRPGNASIHKVTPAGVISTVIDQSTTLGQPLGITVDATGNLFAADSQNHLVFKISPAGIAPVAGLVDSPGSADGLGVQARFFLPQGITVSSGNVLYVTSGTTVRRGQVGGAAAIASQPQSTSVVAGGTAVFTVVAAGTPTPTLQWNFNGSPLAGATGSSLSITSAQAANAGSYTVTATNALGSATSNAAILTVTTSPTNPPPAGGGNGSGGGGGGAPSTWFLGALLALSLARLVRRR